MVVEMRGKRGWRGGEGRADKLDAESMFSSGQKRERERGEINRKAMDKVKVNKSQDKWKLVLILVRRQYLQGGKLFDTCSLSCYANMCMCVCV